MVDAYSGTNDILTGLSAIQFRILPNGWSPVSGGTSVARWSFDVRVSKIWPSLVVNG